METKNSAERKTSIAHVPQFGPECMLVSMAMLARKPIELVRRRACAAAGVILWSQCFDGSQEGKARFHRGVNHVVAFYGLHKFLPSRLGGMPGSPDVDHKDFTSIVPKLTGTAMVIIYCFGSSHAVVFTNGVIHDGNCSKPMLIADWWRYAIENYYPNSYRTTAKVMP